MPTPSNIVLANLTTPPVKGLTSPFIATAPGLRDGTRSTGPNPPTFTLSATSSSITATITNGNGADSYEIRVNSGAAVSGLTVTGLTAEQTYSVQVRGYTGQDAGAWSDPVDQATAAAAQGLIFEESFDDLPETTASDGITAALESAGWTYRRRGGDAGGPHYTSEPGNGDVYEITGAIPEALRGGAGKAFVARRESYSLNDGSAGWNSDGILVKVLETGLSEIFVRFFIKFQPGWTSAGQSKLFRIASLDPGGSPFSFFADGDSAPIFLWDYGYSAYGLRNFLSFRADPQESNYFVTAPAPVELPRAMSSGDIPCNFDQDIRDLGDGTANPITLIDKTTGQVIQPGNITHAQVYGDTWNKVEFHLKMNSAPGAMDGVCRQWVNDQLCFRNTKFPWMGTNSPGGRLWNYVAIGGNDNFNSYPNGQKAQEWYAIDDLEIHGTLPEGMI